jgi:homoserine kinase
MILDPVSATAFAPATIANVAVGFDLLGFPIDGVGDEVTVSRSGVPGVVIIGITDKNSGNAVTHITTDASHNTATVGLIQLLKDLNADFGFSVAIKKGIPMSSGMGGSASSAVAAIVAANALLDQPLSKEKLFHYAMLGEQVASGGMHGDNIAPSLFGGLTLCRSIQPLDLVKIPVPSNIWCVLVHPDLEVSTKESRGKLKKEVTLKDHILQSAALGGFIAGCFQGDLDLIQRSFQDIIIEPQRESQITGFKEAKVAALSAGAIGCAISGSGPSVFAWADSKERAEQIQEVMTREFESKNLKCESWVSPISTIGARILA